jgi:hypothetical protein
MSDGYAALPVELQSKSVHYFKCITMLDWGKENAEGSLTWLEDEVEVTDTILNNLNGKQEESYQFHYEFDHIKCSRVLCQI